MSKIMHVFFALFLCISTASVVSACIANCSQCSDASSCDSCYYGYFLDETTLTCTACIADCTYCSDGSSCDFCDDGYFLDPLTCTACLDTNCHECVDATSCNRCGIGYYLDGQSCTACSANCDRCRDTSSCSECESGYSSDELGSCIVCPVNCHSCPDDGCRYCKDGYFLDEAATCTACSDNCAFCDSSDGCNRCKEGYFVDETSTCTACSSGCAVCEAGCSSCSSGLYLQSDRTCTTSFPVGCVSYNSYPGSTHYCMQCDEGFFQQNNWPVLDCIACPTGCEVCPAASTCFACSSGYYLDGVTCIACPTGCEACTDASTCSACSSGYYLDGVTCIAYVHQIHVLLDLSGSISIPGGELALKTFVHSTMDNLNNRLLSTRVLSIFSDSVEEVYRDGESGDDLGDAIYNMNVSSRGGPTQTAAALEHVQLQVEDVVGCKMILILTDGGSVDPTATAAAAQELREDYNIGVCVVPMGQISCEGQDELHNLAGESGLVVHNFKNMLEPQAAYTTSQSCLDAVCADY